MLILIHKYSQIKNWLKKQGLLDIVIKSAKQSQEFLISLKNSNPKWRKVVEMIEKQLNENLYKF